MELAGLTPESGEFGIAVGQRTLWGRGVGSQAGRLLLAHAFRDLRLHTVTAEVHLPDLPSHTLMWRLGSREMGEGEPDEYQGERVRMIWYALDRAQFLRGRLAE